MAKGKKKSKRAPTAKAVRKAKKVIKAFVTSRHKSGKRKYKRPCGGWMARSGRYLVR
jgi:hypothetical protein